MTNRKELEPPLAMIWRRERVERHVPPQDFVLRSTVDHDRFHQIQSAIGWEMREGQWEELSARVLPGGMIFCEHAASGEAVGVACALVGDKETTVELAWVAVVPHYQGRGLAAAICAEVIAVAHAAGFSEVTLPTRDDRLAALKTYLKLGFEPVVDEASLDRWQSVLRILDWPGDFGA